MARIMRAYVERWRFGHPSSDDFYAVASEVAGRDLRPFFAQTIESPAVVDYELGTIETAPGYTAITARRYGDLQMPVDVAVKFEGRPVEFQRGTGNVAAVRDLAKTTLLRRRPGKQSPGAETDDHGD